MAAMGADGGRRTGVTGPMASAIDTASGPGGTGGAPVPHPLPDTN